MASGGGVWLELHPYNLFASLFHERRSKAIPYTTQTADDVHLTVLYLGKEVTDAQVEVLWREAVLPNLKKNFDFRLGSVHAGSWGPPEVVMMDVALLDQESFEVLYRAFYAKALELGIKVAGTNTSPDKHNGTHITVDKRHTPPYSEGEMTAIKCEMEVFVDVRSYWRDIRIVRGGSQNVLKSRVF
jgi:2'-5' RNA ligase